VVEQDSIGARIRAARRLQDLTQRQLARKAAVSFSLLMKVEQGARSATPPLIAAVARALRLDVTDLTGQPYYTTTSAEEMRAVVGDIRRALMGYDVPPDGVHARPLPELRADVDEIGRLRRAARYAKLAPRLPGLLDELTVALHSAAGDDSAELAGMLATVYRAVDSAAYKLGYLDLSLLAVERFAWLSERSRDPLMPAVAKYLRANSCFATGAYDVGLRLMDRTRDDLPDTASTEGLAVLGSLHLRSGILAARAKRDDDVWAHLAEARAIAQRTGDGGWYELAWGPSNVCVHEVASAVELEQPTRALEAAARAHLSDALPTSRRGHFHIDLARAQVWHGDREAAHRSLLTAEKLTPDQTRNHPMARESVRMLVHLEKTSPDTLLNLAARMGVES
jgi:transcriptional regulator with XRE-family HTH domain